MTEQRRRAGRWWVTVGLPVLTAAAWVISVLPMAGSTASGSAANQITLTWSNPSPAASPPALKYASAVYDSDTKTVVLFGGQRADGTLSDDTWVWNGSNWSDYPGNEVQAPSGRQMAAIGFDPIVHKLILFGGQGAGGKLLGDTWAWNGASWYEQASSLTSTAPGPREAASGGYDGAGHLVLFGGTGFARASNLTAPTGSSGSTAGTAGTNSPAGPAADGSSAQTQSATGAATTTTTVAPSSSPSPSVLGDTWLWTSGGWAPTAGGPPARSGAAFTLDTTHRALLLFGGESTPAGSANSHVLSDTWAWTTAGWARRAPVSSPPGRASAALADNPVVGGVVLFGGFSGRTDLSDLWTWTGANWQQTHGTGTPLARAGAASAYDSQSHQFLLFGGVTPGGAVLGDTLVLIAVTPTPARTVTTVHASPTTRASKPPAHHVAKPATTATKVPRPTTSQSLTLPAPESLVAGPGSPLAANARVLHPGEAVTLGGAGFEPGAAVTITFHSTPQVVGLARAEPDGRFTMTVTVPNSAPAGNHHFEATGRSSTGHTANLTVAVVVVTGSQGGFPARTAAMIGLALLLPAGAWAALGGTDWWRRRRTACDA